MESRYLEWLLLWTSGVAIVFPIECCFVAREIERLRQANCRLTKDLGEFLDGAFRQIANEQDNGWWDTMSLSTAYQLGEQLVEMGLWERQDGTVARRQWYRPVLIEA